MAITEEDLRRLLSVYLNARGSRDGSPEGDARARAFDYINDFVQNDPETCWSLIKAACDEPVSDDDLAYLSAGPFEDLMGAHGDQFIDRVEVFTRQHARMRFLVATVWKGGMANAVWDRLLKLRERLGITSL